MERPVRVLHVDDDPQLRDMSARFLEQREAFEVLTEPGVDDGLQRLAAEPIDCIVSDYSMTEQTGVDFLKEIRKTQPSIPFILFTGEGSESVASEALRHGATDYLRKGTGTEQYELLGNKIANAVESHRTERERHQYKTLVETAGEAMYVLDETATITHINLALAELLACEPDAVIDKHATEFLSEEAFKRAQRLRQTVLDDPDRSWGRLEAIVTTANGTAVESEITVAPLRDESNTYAGAVGIIRPFD